MNHSNLAPAAAVDELPCLQIGRVEAVAVTDQQRDTRLGAVGDHRIAFLQAQRHRFFDQHMFAVCCSKGDMRGVHLMRTGDVNDLDLGMADQLLDTCIGGRGEVSLELIPGLRPGVAGRNQTDPRVGQKCGQHQREGASESSDANAERCRFLAHEPGSFRGRA